MARRSADRLAATAAVAVFCAAIAVLVHEFSGVSPRDLLIQLVALPKRQVFAAILLTATSYVLLTGYDFLALRYVQRRLRFCNVLFASFTAFAFGNSIGFQPLSGGSMRYRIYTGLGLDTISIGEIVAFCTCTYALGVTTVGGLVALLEPAEVASMLHLPPPLMAVAGLALLVASAGYVVVSALWRTPIAIGRYRLRPPTLMVAVSQVVLASIDAALAGMVIYVLLPADMDVTYESFLGLYIIAATAGVLSLVPGGIGVFEAVIVVMVAPVSRTAVLDAFVAYRMIYFMLPLLMAIVWFSVHEFRQRSIRK